MLVWMAAAPPKCQRSLVCLDRLCMGWEPQGLFDETIGIYLQNIFADMCLLKCMYTYIHINMCFYICIYIYI